jgi:hypothetical protein
VSKDADTDVVRPDKLITERTESGIDVSEKGMKWSLPFRISSHTSISVRTPTPMPAEMEAFIIEMLLAVTMARHGSPTRTCHAFSKTARSVRLVSGTIKFS